jgi:MFS family permease
MDSTMAAPTMSARTVLKIREFRLLWLAQVISDFGDSLTNLTLLILINQLTGSTAALATMAIVLGIPQVTFGLLAGVYVDRWDRKRIMFLSDLLRGAMVLGFIGAIATGQIWLLYVVAFIQASIGTFFTPARSALLPRLVPRTGLLAANSLSQISRIIAGVAGSAAAGVLVGAFNVTWPAFTFDALTFFVSALLVSRIVVRAAERPAAPASSGTPREIFAQLAGGLQVIAHSRILTGTLMALAVTMLGLGAVNVLIVPLIINDLHVPATWFGAVEFAQTASMVLSGGLVAVLAARLKMTQIVTGSLVLIGLLTGLIALSGTIWHLLLILFAVGWLVTPLQAAVATIMQTAVDDHMRGRIGAALNTVLSTASLVSMGLAGVFGQLVGIRTVFILAGIVTVLAGLAAIMIFRAPAPEVTLEGAEPAAS